MLDHYLAMDPGIAEEEIEGIKTRSPLLAFRQYGSPRIRETGLKCSDIRSWILLR